MKTCPVCNHEEVYIRDSGYYEINCKNCGKYAISYEAKEDTSPSNFVKIGKLLTERKLQNYERLLLMNERGESHLPIITINELVSSFPQKFSERLDRTLLNFSRISEFPGQRFRITEKDKNLFFVETNEMMEIHFLMNQLSNDGYIDGHEGSFPSEITVTAKGWEKVGELEKVNDEKSNSVFVAMWFAPEMESPYENSIRKALVDLGFSPIRIDKKEHNNKIDDEIIAEIKKCKFLIADFTGDRGGVYFEAGYAMGLGKPVIWMVREDNLPNVHFDTRQYSHIVWNDEIDLYTRLYNRIRATIS